MPRGGRRQGAPGATYTNRSDLQTAPRVASGVPAPPVYGDKVAQQQSLQAVPMPAQPPAPVSGPPLVPLDAPTQHPAQPITSGLPTGPGPGPEALSLLGTPGGGIAQMLDEAAQQSGSESLALLARRAREMGQ